MNDRRNLIKRIGYGLVWSTPIIQSVSLPAHAQTSSCNEVASGCYSSTSTASFFWPGGGGVHTVEYYRGFGLDTCIGPPDSITQLQVAVAQNEIEAATLLDVPPSDVIPFTIRIDNAPNCTFYHIRGEI